MAYKHIKEYYEKVCNQYLEMKKEIADWEIEASKNMVDPERLQGLKDMMVPLKQNYQRWSYMMFLLNQPVRPKKYPKYKRQNTKLLNKLDPKNSIEATIKENAQVINNIKSDRESIAE